VLTDAADKARLISPTYPSTRGDGDCFKFWYHLNGPNTGLLSILLKRNGTDLSTLWSRNKNLGNAWRYGHVSVKSEVDFRLVIEGKPFVSFNSKLTFLKYFILNVKSQGSFNWVRLLYVRYFRGIFNSNRKYKFLE
jgi:hypothetical protein